MFPSGPRRTTGLPSLTVAGLVCAGLFAWLGTASDAVASCGDYLLPPHQISRQLDLPPELAASGVSSPHSDRPCRGPHCRQAPRPEPTPPAPLTTLVQDHLACPPAPATLSRFEPWSATSGIALHPRAGAPTRIDRPPRG